MVVTAQAQPRRIIRRLMTEQEFQRLIEKEGVYQPGRNYNVKVDGHGTGLKPPSMQQWLDIKKQRVLVEDMVFSNTSAPASVDNSNTPWFPPIGNQDGEGSCTTWATGYYTKTFQEAKEHGWDLSGATWDGGYYGAPNTAYQDRIFSPDFIYHQVNNGDDNGSYYSDNLNLLERIGCCTYDQMPYDPADHSTWPSEAAFRQAPWYRSATGYSYLWVDSQAGFDDLKLMLSEGNLAVISINANEYGEMVDETWTLDTYQGESTNHANTIVGYDDNYGPYEENGNTNVYGAFKVANSWGLGFSGDDNADGFYWISYECMMQRVEYIFFYENKVAYEPEMLAVFEMDHDYRGENRIDFGIGDTASPDTTKPFDQFNYNGGDHPYPDHPIVMDISGFTHFVTGPPDHFFMRVLDEETSSTGTIESFKIEMYDDYASGTPTEIYTSTMTPVVTVADDYVYAELYTGENTIVLDPSSLHIDENSGDAVFNVYTNSGGATSWTAEIVNGGTWLNITSGTSGAGDGEIHVHYDDNTDLNSREGMLRVTAAWASNSPLEAPVLQDGIRNGLAVQVYDVYGNPEPDAEVQVYVDTLHYDDYSGYTDSNGYVELTDVPDGSYVILVRDFSDHFLFVLYDVIVPGRLDLYAADLTPVEISATAKDGVSPIDASIRFCPFKSTLQHLGYTDESTGSITCYVTNHHYTGIAANCYDQPYHLVYQGQNVTGSTSYEFNPVTMATGTIYPQLDDFESMRFYTWCGYSNWSSSMYVDAGDNIVMSVETYSLGPGMRKQDGEGYSWTYRFDKNNQYSSFQVEENQSYNIEAGGVYTMAVVPEQTQYDAGDAVYITNDILDAYSNKIIQVQGWIPDAAESETPVAIDEPLRVEYEDGQAPDQHDGPDGGSYGYFYPSIKVENPNSVIVSEDSSGTCFYRHEFTLATDAMNGVYPVNMMLDTGPHQGILSTQNSFTVGDDVLTVTSPNGGEVWDVLTTKQIQWSSSGNSGTVTIEYSTDAGTSWRTIVTNESDDGIYDWFIANTPSEHCLVRVMDSDGSPSDISNAVFTLPVLEPDTLKVYKTAQQPAIDGDGDETAWQQTERIYFEKCLEVVPWPDDTNDFSGFYKVLWDDNYFYYYAEVVDDLLRYDHSTTWQNDGIWLYFDGDNSKGASYDGVDDAHVRYAFDNATNPTAIGPLNIDNVDIAWAEQDFGWTVELAFPFADMTFDPVENHTYGWETQISDNDEGQRDHTLRWFHESDQSWQNAAYFGNAQLVGASTQTISVTAPNGGELWASGETETIEWTSSNTSPLVRLYYSVDNGTSWIVMNDSTDNDGSYVWVIPNVSSTQCLVKVEDRDGAPQDVSDAMFTIRNSSQHFQTVWQTSPFNPMSIYCSNAELHNVDLEAGDEIGVFDAEKCVGVYVLTEPLTTSTIANIVCSADDGGGNGFTDGNEISYKVWDASEGKEYTASSEYFDCNTGSPVAPAVFQALASACVELNAPGILGQTISFTAGWNMYSLAVESQDSHDMLDMLSPILEDYVLKVIDEQGKTVEKIFGNWQNYIGDWLPTEGYYIKVTDNIDYMVEGLEIESPFDIPLSGGWNMISYICLETEQDALDVMQPLIDNEFLLKVIDSAGNTVEKVFGSWQNYIGAMKAGEGYYVKVTESCTLVETCEPNTSHMAKAEAAAPIHFVAEYGEKPFKPMSIYIRDVQLNNASLQPGDEVAVYKNDDLIGSAVWRHDARPMLIVAPGVDDDEPGFIVGDVLNFKVWSKTLDDEKDVHAGQIEWFDSSQTVLDDPVTFEQLGSAYISIDLDKAVVELPTEYKLYSNYPNPFNPTTTISFDLPQASDVRLEIYNTMGRRVRILQNNFMEPGRYKIVWNGQNDTGLPVVSGLYLCKLKAGKFVDAKKMALVK
jgi:hypothetical protein